MDCVWQITRQFPTAFEFSNKLLLLIMHHLYSGLYGTFICNSPGEKKRKGVDTCTVSLWTEIRNRVANDEFRNGNYSPLPSNISRVLVPSHSIKRLSLWTDYYLRWIVDTHVTQIPLRPVVSATEEVINNNDINKSRTLSQQNREHQSSSFNNEGDDGKKKIHHSDEELPSPTRGINDNKIHMKLVQKNKDLQNAVENLKRENLLIQKQNGQLIDKYHKLKKKLKGKNINIPDSDSDSDIDTQLTRPSANLSTKNSPVPPIATLPTSGKEKRDEVSAFPGIPLYTEGSGPRMSPRRSGVGQFLNPRQQPSGQPNQKSNKKEGK